jgi:hypothetical protein
MRNEPSISRSLPRSKISVTPPLTTTPTWRLPQPEYTSRSLSRHRFLTNSAFAGAASLGGFGAWGKALAAEPPPEITTIRFEKDPVTCIAPQVFQELLRAQGFTDIRYMGVTEAHTRRADAENSGVVPNMIAHREVDFGRELAPSQLLAMNGGAPITILPACMSGARDHWVRGPHGTFARRLVDELSTGMLVSGKEGRGVGKDSRWRRLRSRLDLGRKG